MPRIARKKSESGMYHIMLRGINQQVIFEDQEDYTKFISTLVRYKTICGFKLHAYCLMPNHIHILIKPEKEDLDLIVKRIAGSYVYWYNAKYYRKGHLFQDRFRSEPVEDDSYFLTVIRYIHQNPVKAKLSKSPQEYEFSSYCDYISGKKMLVDSELALDMIGMNQFVAFNNEENIDECLELSDQEFRLSDNDAKKIVFEITQCDNKLDLKSVSSADKERYIKILKMKGLSIRQISRFTGIGKSFVEKTKI